ncbi:MAG: nucleoside hydrolase [candidate division Zixibacteria bacterium]|nr:nucleoside hydrolase [candidate division Zixibacteria bacterium]
MACCKITAFYQKLIIRGLVLILITAVVPAVAHDVKIPVVVDTDVALDDLRALTLLLSDGHFQIKAVVTSDGACSPVRGAANIKRALNSLGMDNIPVGVGRELSGPLPPWRSMSEAMGWADIQDLQVESPSITAVEILERVFGDINEPVTYICLGSLSNLADFLQKNPFVKNKIGAVYYYGSLLDNDNLSWNTARDTSSAREVLRSGLDIYTCSRPDSLLLSFDTEIYDSLCRLTTPGAAFLNLLHADEKVQSLLNRNHFIAWDETVALCLIEPATAEFKSVESPQSLYYLESFDRRVARHVYLQTLKRGVINTMGNRRAVIFENFPTDPELFRADIRPLVSELLEHHGPEEWSAVLLTNELHRHLGIYSIIGAKMGICAREILNASLDDLEVISFAGSEPPLSCMNDGLQAATGASLGRGTIRVETTAPAAAAVFVKKDKRLKLEVKKEIIERIRADIKRAIEQYGNLTPAYFAEVRRLSLNYWREMDRKMIFDEFTD